MMTDMCNEKFEHLAEIKGDIIKIIKKIVTTTEGTLAWMVTSEDHNSIEIEIRVKSEHEAQFIFKEISKLILDQLLGEAKIQIEMVYSKLMVTIYLDEYYL